MTTTMTLDDVRANLIARGYPAEQIDEMLNLAGRMILEGSLASKDDVTQLRDEFTLFKIDVAERFAELRTEMYAGFAEMNVKFVEVNAKFAEQNASINAKFAEQDANFAEQNASINAKFAEMDVKFAEQDAKFAEQNSSINAKFAEMDAKFAEQNASINAKFAEQDAKSATRENRILRWVFGGIIAGIAINAAIVSIGVAVIAQID